MRPSGLARRVVAGATPAAWELARVQVRVGEIAWLRMDDLLPAATGQALAERGAAAPPPTTPARQPLPLRDA